ncbi:MAG: adenylate/guanylate cyclase domain-containing protein [Polyangiaceae bacterium]
MNTRPLIDFLISGAPGKPRSPDVLAHVSTELSALGVPVDRTEAFVRTLHPHIAGRSFVWRPNAPVEIHEQSYAYLESAAFRASPVGCVFRTGEWERRHLSARDSFPDEEAEYLSALAARGYRDVVVAPLRFLTGQTHAISFATKDARGFSDEHVDAIASVMPALSRIAEILALSRTAANLLNTYVGHGAGERILAGKIVRGDVEPIKAVIWFSDLRNFTTLSATQEPAETIMTLNEVFDCQVPAIERHRGEVLKFMGDGLLGIIPIREESNAAANACKHALDAADEAYGALVSVNAKRVARRLAPVRFGLALHIGEVAYGNIGGAGRLDFTCIGPAVNLAARIEGLTSKLDRNVLVSEDFARASSALAGVREMDLLGEFELKGVAALQRVYAPGATDDPTVVP